MASIIGKTVHGRKYYYLVETARVDGQPRIVSQRYLGSAAAIAYAVLGESAADADSRNSHSTGPPTRVRRVPFGDVAATWAMLEELGLPELVDEVAGAGRSTVSPGTYAALTVLHRIATSNPAHQQHSTTVGDGPESGRGTRYRGGASPSSAQAGPLAAWWPTTTAARFVRPRPNTAALAPRRIWRAFDRITDAHLQQFEEAVAARITDMVGNSSTPALAFDIAHLTSYHTGHRVEDRHGDNGKLWDSAEIPVGLALVVTLDGAVPIRALPYRSGPGGSPSFADVVTRLSQRHQAAAPSGDGGGESDQVTAIVEVAQSGRVDLGLAPNTSYVAPLPPGDHPDLLTPRGARQTVDAERFPDLSAWETRARVGGADRRVVGIYSPSLRQAQDSALTQQLQLAVRRLTELSHALQDNTIRPRRERLSAEINAITRFRWGDRVLSTRVERNARGALRLDWHVDEAALERLRADLFGRQLLATDHDNWPVAQVITAYRARFRVEATLRRLVPTTMGRLRAPHGWHGPSQSPDGGGTDLPPRVATDLWLFVLATAVAHLMRWRAQQTGITLSAQELLDRLGQLEEIQLRQPSTGGRPRTLRVLSNADDELTNDLYDVFGLHRYAP